MNEKYESFAAIAVFKEMYDQKKDVYDIIGSFCTDVICNEELTNFTSPEITQKVNETFSFSLKEPIIKTSLNRLKNVYKEGGMYHVIQDYSAQQINNSYRTQASKNNSLLEGLYAFVQNKNKKILSEVDKENIKKHFFDYLMDENSLDEYGEDINQYVLSISMKEEYIDTIKKIKEGLLIYDGIRYSGNVNELGRWNSRLNIYMEQEVLFYIAGYNGEIHQEIYREFLSYVSEINRGLSGDKKLIKLWYDEDVKSEMDSYFKAAERIIEKGEIPDPSRKPMMYILDGAKTISDIVGKRAKFYRLLQHYGINIFQYEYYSEDKFKYNIESEPLYRELTEKYKDGIRDEDDIKKYCKKINNIAILRKGQNIGFDNVEHILMTAKGLILQLGHEKDFCNQGEVPKVTTVDFLLNKMWFKLNKGFGEGLTPKTIDVVTHARVALSFLANDKVEKIYEDIKKKFNSQEITRDEAIQLIADLRSYSKIPDDIDSNTIEDEIKMLSQYEVDKRVEELKREEIERKKDKTKISDLESQIKVMQDENERILQNQQQSQQSKMDEFYKIISEMKDENEKLKNKVEKYEMEKAEKNKIRRLKKRRLGFLIRLIITILAGFVLYLILSYGIKVEHSISGVTSIVIAVLVEVKPIIEFIKGNKI